ncbi:heat shock factor 2-binding protein isoform X2 [Phacochoerus africanus]|uniref:heat shock factor 2-binding protein isoform X2 n=1 Tax=Phacochoerus africanus TaxID=41426 RepID=UPI001FDA8F5B|nr:heat shock factor 2-binding protein isoform X2 [Phacochoerus africanus]
MGEAGGAEEPRRHVGTKEEFVRVRKKDLERLTTEVMQIRDFLPRILNGDVLESFQKLKMLEKNLERKEQELEQLRMDCEHFKARLESVQADSVREKKEKLALRQQLNEAKQQLLQQAEYCTEMGAAACTILWGVSSSEEVVKAILGGGKAVKFFSITGQTMESFVKSLDGDAKELDSDENQFVFALAGIVTNVAAIACGREFLVTSSRVLLDTILQLLGDLKPGQCTRLKVSGCGGVSSCSETCPVCGSGARSLLQVGLGAPQLPAPAAHPGHVQEPQPPPAERGPRAPGGPPCSGARRLGRSGARLLPGPRSVSGTTSQCRVSQMARWG